MDVPFTRESWHGRMRACRGVGASMTGDELAAWDKEHANMLMECAKDTFSVKHYVSIAVLEKQ